MSLQFTFSCSSVDRSLALDAKEKSWQAKLGFKLAIGESLIRWLTGWSKN